MRLLFDLKKIRGKFNYKGKMRLRLKIGEGLTIFSEMVSFNNGSYAFLEKQTVRADKFGDQIYTELSLVAETGVMLAQITVFFSKFKDLNQIEIKTNNEVYVVCYSISQIADEDDEILPGVLRRTSTIDDNTKKIGENSGKLEVLRLGVLMYEFAQRLDPLIYVFNRVSDLFMWKNPYKTLSMGILLTLVIYNLKISILVGGLLLYFGKQFIFRRLMKLSVYKNIHKRLIIPEENAYFLQHNMDNYCHYYENICEFLFNDDKTILVNIIKLLCKMGIFLIILLFFFGVEHLIVLGLWAGLFLTSPYRKSILQYTKPLMEFVVGEYSKVMDKITTGLSSVLGSNIQLNNDEMQKEFYFYKYERWWVVKGWLEETKKYSDEDYECFIVPREEAPEGWAWIQEWKIDFSGEVDSDGYQYANDIKTEFNSNNTLATRRRRRWKRSCSKLRSEPI